MSSETQHPDSSSPLVVLYDGACPLCRREIGYFRKRVPREPVEFHDVSRQDAVLPMGLDRDAVLERFHVICPGGRVLSGGPAFIAMWRRFAGWRWLARVPGIEALASPAYRKFLRIRPRLQRLVRSLEREQAPAPRHHQRAMRPLAPSQPRGEPRAQASKSASSGRSSNRAAT